MEQCSFCETLADLKQLHRETNRERRSRGVDPMINNFTSALVDRSHFKGRAGRARCIYFGGRRRFPLNYCPECGQKLTRKRTEV